MKTIVIICPLEKHFDRMSHNFIMPRYGTIAIATALKNAGYRVKVFSEFIRCEIDWEFVKQADYVCFSLMTFCAKRGYQIAAEIKKINKVPIIFGGAHPTVLPEECLEHCDFVVRNEGEATLLELLDCLENGRSVAAVEGLSFRNAAGQPVHNPNRDFMEDIDVPQDVTLLNDYDLVGQKYYGKNAARHYMQVVQTTRGCPFNCKFCVAPKELGTRYRMKSITTVLTDIENSRNHTKSDTFMLVDNEFTVNRGRTVELLKAIIDKFGSSLNLVVFARNEIGSQPEILRLMKQAGVSLVFVGVESVNEETLKYYEKKVTLDQVKANIDRIHEAGIYTIGSTILGSDYDTPDTIRNTYQFFVDHKFSHAHFYALYEIPTKQKVLNLPQMFSDNRFIHYDWRFYTSGFVIHYPKYMKPSTLQKLIIHNYQNFYSTQNRTERDPLRGTPYSRLGFLLRMVNPELYVMRKYIPFLEEFEEGMYDENEHLIESKLPAPDQFFERQTELDIDLSQIENEIF